MTQQEYDSAIVCLCVRQIAPQVLLTEDEMEYRMKQEYQQYLEAESTFLRDLGLLKEDDDMLAETD